MFRIAVVTIGMMMLRSTLAFGFRIHTSPSRRTREWWTITATSPSTIFQRRQNINRIYHHGRLSLASSKVPTVEVSHSDHCTSPLSDFVSSTVLDSRLVKALQSPSMNITTPTPIQSHAMPLLFNSYDVMASSATG